MPEEHDPREIRYIEITELKFDPENPRLPTRVDGQDEDAVLQWMLEDATIIELMLSIGEHGYFPGEPILVTGQNNSGYVVVEGNRRLAAIQLLQNPELAKVRKKAVREAATESEHKPKELPAVVFSGRDKILDYLGYRHITGIKQWSPLAKARYLAQLQQQLKQEKPLEKFRILARRIGSRSDYVARLLAGLALFKRIAENSFFEIKDLNEESLDFSILTTAINYSNIAKYLGLKSGRDPTLKGLKKNNFETLSKWLFERDENDNTRLGESRDLKDLNEIVANKDALSAFHDGMDLEAAANIARTPTERSEVERFRITLSYSFSQLRRAKEYADRINVFESKDQESTSEIVALASELRDEVAKKALELKAH